MNTQNRDYIEMIGCAVKAPSGHNSQPWLFRIEENVIVIQPDYSKSLRVVDGNSREMLISLGCATENLCVAAMQMNYKPDVEISSEGTIKIHLEKFNYTLPNTLFDQIDKRQTNRSVYNGNIISNTTLEKLHTLKKEPFIQFYTWERNTPVFDMLKSYVAKGNSIQMSDKAFKEELKSWMRFNKSQSEATNDGLSYATLGVPCLPSLISKPITDLFLNPKNQNKRDMKMIGSSSHFVLFTTKNNTPQEWVSLGRTLERFLLTASQENLAMGYMDQPCELNTLASELQQLLPINGEYPTILLHIGYAKPMPYSKRKSLESVLIKTE